MELSSRLISSLVSCLVITTVMISCKSISFSGEKKVLFIGNSTTYYNGMPDHLREMLQEAEIRMRVEVISYPGVDLKDHLNKVIQMDSNNVSSTSPKQNDELTDTEKLLTSKKWDYVILQDQSVGILIPDALERNIIPSIEKVKELVHKKTKIGLFETWVVDDNFPTQFCWPTYMIDSTLNTFLSCSRNILSLEDQQTLLDSCYQYITQITKVEVISMNQPYFQSLDNQIKLELSDQNGHPTEIGALYNAYAFFKYLTGKDVNSILYSGDQSDSTRSRIIELLE